LGAAGKGSAMAIGLLLGLIVGVAMAAGLAWYLMKSPAPFVNKTPVVSRTEVEEKNKAAAAEVVQSKQPADDGKPRFEFYKVLTDKQDAAALPSAPGKTAPAKMAMVEPSKPAVSTAAKPAASVADKQTYFLQTGAFVNEAEAEKMKASLIFDGMEVTVLAVNTPDKGLLHKVRIGPYQGADEMNSVRAKLKLKGIPSTPIRSQ
jgi:cell division protein FtsN